MRPTLTYAAPQPAAPSAASAAVPGRLGRSPIATLSGTSAGTASRTRVSVPGAGAPSDPSAGVLTAPLSAPPAPAGPAPAGPAAPHGGPPRPPPHGETRLGGVDDADEEPHRRASPPSIACTRTRAPSLSKRTTSTCPPPPSSGSRPAASSRPSSSLPAIP